jgi:hypothetical protein
MDSTALTVTSFLGSAMYLVVDVIFIVVALTSVRRHRPDAALVFTGAAVLEIFTSLAGWVGYYVAARVLARSWSAYSPSSSGGLMGSYYTIYGAIHLGTSLMGVLAKVMMIVGVVRLATPAPQRAYDPGRYE